MPVNPWKQFELAPPGVVPAGSGFAAVSRISMLLGMRERSNSTRSRRKACWR
jgi:hypothetical protein